MKNISPRKVLTALIRAEGRIKDAARMLHTQPRNIARILDENPDIQEEMDQCHIDLLDEALESAKDLVKNRDRDMTKFVIDRLGEKRGLKAPKKKVEVSGDAENPLVTKNQIDLSCLSDAELEALQKALKASEE